MSSEGKAALKEHDVVKSRAVMISLSVSGSYQTIKKNIAYKISGFFLKYLISDIEKYKK